MQATELCQYVKHYIEEDKTRSAIMLNGEWGTGKSYFIEKELIPFLVKEKNGSHRCVTISLYGLKDISEISKAIYFDLRLKKSGDLPRIPRQALFLKLKLLSS